MNKAQLQLKALEKQTVKLKERYYKLFILPLDLELKNLKLAQKGKIKLNMMNYLLLRRKIELRKNLRDEVSK